MAPKVSIGMPVYNGQDYLEDAIAAILAQTYTDFELIISDNCSTDQTPSICQAVATREQRVRYVRQEQNLGAIGNFNALVHQAKGKYFKWAAHDDLMAPTFVEKCVAILDRNESVSWCHALSDMIDAGGRSFRDLLPATDEELLVAADGTRSWKGHPRAGFDSSDPIERFKGVILGTNWCVDSYGLFRLETLKQTRLLLPFYGAEKVLLGEVSLLGCYQEVPELLFFQRVHDKASSNLQSAASQANFAESSRKVKKFMAARLRIPHAHLGAVLRSPLSFWKKVRGFGAVIRYFFQFRKWGRVITKMIRGTGLGGGGRRILRSTNQSSSTGSTSNAMEPPRKTV